ncbi:MAG: tetratricopeptide repeat protein [Okeania sp. SIO3I5]|uniref:tetratricopeptide repeat-containing sulfotransferase family protein n=1 Tax=Okeania sp. SIO3I5 TaxID=2607805 RepID=UPI0013BC0376|nr:tetratricopeptide repeat-containing sulfotransferase family protein [Okeania sp. SIO3I5]NEQ39467.1 tetratricopeptide repeat protein [Okeania sp. SIO3I5]
MNYQRFVLDLHQEAESCFAQEKLHEAEIICDKIIEIQSDFAPAYNTLGKVLQVMGKLDLAKENYQQAILINPNLVEAYTNLGNLHSQQKQWPLAITSYSQALHLNKNKAEIYHKLGEALLQLEKWNEAVVTYRKATELNPNFPWSYHKLGTALLALEKWDEAIIAYKKFIELNPDFPWSYHKLGEALLQLKKWDEAIIAYRKFIELNPTFPWSYHKLGTALLKLEQWDEAVKAFRRAIELKPNLYLPYKNLGDALMQLSEYSEAVTVYRQAIEIDPNIDVNYYNLGNALVKLERYSEAVGAYSQATKIHPNSSLYYEQLATALVRLAEVEKNRQFNIYSEASACYETLIQLQPRQRENYHKLADILQKQGKFEAAIDSYIQAIKFKPDVPWSYNSLGEILMKLKRWNQAIFTFLNGLNLEQNMPWIYKQLGEALAKVSPGNLETKINYYCSAVKNNQTEIINSKLALNLPQNSELYLYLGNYLSNKEQYKGAVIIYNIALQLKVKDQEIKTQLQQTLEKKLELELEVERCHQTIKQNPKSSKYYYDLGIALTRQEEWEKASSVFVKAIKLNPEINWSYNRFWNYLKQSDMLDEVVKLYHQIIQKKPHSVLCHLNLGEILSEQGKIDAAIASYRTACYEQTIKSHPNFVTRYWHQKQVANPNFMIIGTGKSGTTSLYNYLSQHPQVLPAIKKEIYFWSRHFDKGINWYLAHFPPIPKGTKFLTGEATPTYINSRQTPARLFSIFPQIKLIIILRNPVDRAISHYYHEVRSKMENKSLSEAIFSQLERLQKIPESALQEAYWNHISYYISYGVYVEFIKKWMDIFPREQFLILRSEDFYQDPGITMQKVFKFLGLPKYQLQNYKKLNSGSYPTVPQSISSALSNYFQPYNQRLEAFLGMKFNWEKRE